VVLIACGKGVDNSFLFLTSLALIYPFQKMQIWIIYGFITAGTMEEIQSGESRITMAFDATISGRRQAEANGSPSFPSYLPLS